MFPVKGKYNMATSVEKTEDVELKAVTGKPQEIPKKKGAGLKLKTQDPKETKRTSADYKRTHSYPEDKKPIIKKAKQKSRGSHPEIIQRLQSQQGNPFIDLFTSLFSSRSRSWCHAYSSLEPPFMEFGEVHCNV